MEVLFASVIEPFYNEDQFQAYVIDREQLLDFGHC